MRGTRAAVVVKFGGELVERADALRTIIAALAAARDEAAPLVVVHGGGREIDAALKSAGIPKQQVEGLRVTDEATLSVVVAVLAGSVNTRLVASLVAAGVPAVGLTGADAGCGSSVAAPPHRTVDGRLVDLGHVGVPVAGANVEVVATLADRGYVPVIASIGVDGDGRLLNVNADTFAASIASRLGAARLLVAGTTPGVLDEVGATIEQIAPADIERLVSGGTATAGMIAKLRACERAVAEGVGDVVILDGRDPAALQAALRGGAPAAATRVVGARGHASGRAREARSGREASASGGGAPRESKE